MRAKVIGIESGSTYTDGQRRIHIKFKGEDCSPMFDSIKVSEAALGIAGLKLDDELDVGFMPVGVYVGLHGETLEEFGTTVGKARKEGLLK